MMFILSFLLIGVLGIPQLYIDSKSNSFGDFALGAGFDVNRFEPMTQHVFREFGTDGVTYDFMPLTNSRTRCGIVRTADDVTEQMFIRGEVSVDYKGMSGSGFLEFDQKQERMRRKMYFSCIVDRGLFTISVNPPQIKSDTTDEEKEDMLPTSLLAITNKELFLQEAGEYHVRSITYGRRYQTEVTMSYTNDESYERIEAELEAEYGVGFLTVSAKINLEMQEESSESDLRMSAASESYGFIQPKALFLPTEVDEDGSAPFEQMQQLIEENLEAFNNLDSAPMQAQTGISRQELFGLVGDAYPLYYTVARNAPYYAVLEPMTAIQESDMIANVDEAYDTLRELKDLYKDIDIRAETLFENYHLLSGANELSLRFLEIRQELMDRIILLQIEIKEYLGQYPIELATKAVYVWAYTEDKTLKHTSLEILRSDVWRLMGMEDAHMETDDAVIGSKCIFNGIQADYTTTIDGVSETERLKFAGRVVFGDKVIRHVVFDVNGNVVSLGYIDHSAEEVNSTPDLSNHPFGLTIPDGPHELVYVRGDCTFLRVSTPVWYEGSRYLVSEIGSADHRTPHGYVNKEKLSSIRVYLIPVDSTRDITVVLTEDEIDGISLRGAPNSDHFTLDAQSRLMYMNGYVCDWGFGSKEAKMICSTLGYSRLDKFEANTMIPTANAWDRPYITMYDLECDQYSTELDSGCTWETDQDAINWNQCGPANGIELACTDIAANLEEHDVVVEIDSSNNEGCTFNEDDVAGEGTDVGLIDTNEHCLGGEDHLDHFGQVNDVSVHGDVCLKFFVNDEIQCVFPAGSYDFQTNALYDIVGDGWCRPSAGPDERINAYRKTGGMDDDSCRAQCDLEENCFGYSIAQSDHATESGHCYIHVYQGTPTPNGWEAFEKSHYDIGSANGDTQVKCYTKNVDNYASSDHCYPDYDFVFPEDVEVIHDAIPLGVDASETLYNVYTISVRLLEFMGDWSESSFPVEVEITSGEETHTIMVTSIGDSFLIDAIVYRCAQQFHAELKSNQVSSECHFVGDRPVDVDGNGIVDGDIEIEFTCTLSDRYVNLGTGACQAEDDGYLDRYYGTATTHECEDLCTANIECLGYDIYESNPEKCHLFVSDGVTFSYGTPSGFTYSHNIHDGTYITGAFSGSFPVGCMKKTDAELSVGAEMMSLTLQDQFDSKWMRVLAIVGLASAILNFYSRFCQKRDTYESIDDIEV